MPVRFLTICLAAIAMASLSAAQTGFPLPPKRPAGVPNSSGSVTSGSSNSQSASDSSFAIPPLRRPDTIPPKQSTGLRVPTPTPSLPTPTPSPQGTQAQTQTQPTGAATPPVLPAGCFDQLKALNVIFVESPDIDGPGDCGLTDGVEVSGFDGIRLRPPAPMTCPVAVAIALWMRDSVVPEARNRFGQYVADVNQVSTYSCRSRPSGRLSEHAIGNAIDISGFRLGNNSRISIEPDWNSGRKGRFLQAIAKTSCRYFSTVLTPLSDADHQDHFHLDRGTWVSCGG